MCKSLTVTVSGESPWFITLVIGFVPDSLLLPSNTEAA